MHNFFLASGSGFIQSVGDGEGVTAADGQDKGSRGTRGTTVILCSRDWQRLWCRRPPAPGHQPTTNPTVEAMTGEKLGQGNRAGAIQGVEEGEVDVAAKGRAEGVRPTRWQQRHCNNPGMGSEREIGRKGRVGREITRKDQTASNERSQADTGF